jgi:hypothetical protein
MSHKHRRVLWIALLIVACVSAATLILAHPRTLVERLTRKPTTPASGTRVTQGKKADTVRPRNLSLQPEAFNLSRRLGDRFAADKRAKSVLVGTLTIGSERRNVQTTRTQTDDGEQVEINVAGSPGSLTWNATQGFLSSGVRASGSDRELIERLVLDSPDQFVLAQLRGASYYTVARAVRPAKAGDNYSGPVWNVVRITDPEGDETKKPQSAWRLYYINVSTGLIDKVISEVSGQRITSEFTAWSEVNGEKVPTHIRWSTDAQTLMAYDLTNFSHAEK